MDAWVLWLIAAVVFGVGEIATLSFFLAPFAGGALVAALVAAARRRHGVSWAVFLVVSVSCSPRCGRSPARTGASRRRCAPARPRWSAAPAMVLERIANDEGVGCVRIDGEVWTARSYDDDDVIEAGKRVQVSRDQGRHGARHGVRRQ